MTHNGELISAYLDGELSHSEVQGLMEHMGACQRCASEMEELQAVRAAVRSLPLLEMPIGLVPEADVVQLPLRHNRGFRFGAAAAIAALIVAVAALVTPPPPTIAAEDLAIRFGARASLDPTFGPAKVVIPEIRVPAE